MKNGGKSITRANDSGGRSFVAQRTLLSGKPSFSNLSGRKATSSRKKTLATTCFFFFSCALLCSRSCLIARSFVGGRFGSATVSQALSAKHGEPRTHGREEERCGEASSHPRLDLLWCLRPRREIGADELRLRPTAGTTSCSQWWNAGGGEDLFSRIWRERAATLGHRWERQGRVGVGEPSF
jgi:hypothetical protein